MCASARKEPSCAVWLWRLRSCPAGVSSVCTWTSSIYAPALLPRAHMAPDLWLRCSRPHLKLHVPNAYANRYEHDQSNVIRQPHSSATSTLKKSLRLEHHDDRVDNLRNGIRSEISRDIRISRLLINIINACETLDFSVPCPLVKSSSVNLLAVL
jgi:hypothetical protein